ncbi:MAG TPA: methyltransferase [Nitrososphaeraceae archaeon]
MSSNEKTLDVIFGRWKSQILYAGVKLEIFDNVTPDPKEAVQIARDLGLDEVLSYRLLRALASLGFLKEETGSRFSITMQGELMRKDHPQTLRGITLLEEGPEHYQIWKHLPAMIKDGRQNAFIREYDHGAFEYAEINPEYAQVFNQAMSSYSRIYTQWVLEAFDKYDFSNIQHLCDIGGGHGHMLSHLLAKYPHMKGSVLELGSVIQNKELLWANKVNVADRCQYINGDMFREVPSADAYIMKLILHDWNDEECVKILSNIYNGSTDSGRVFIVEHLVPDPNTSHFSKLFDMHMMCWGSGRERTVEEYSALLQQSGWNYVQTFYPKNGLIGIVEGAKSKP